MPDLRAECLAMAERLDKAADDLRRQALANGGTTCDPAFEAAICDVAVAMLCRVADALPQEPQGDVVEAVAKAIRDEASRGIGLARLFSEDGARAALSAAEPFIQARIAAAVEDGGWQPIETAPSGRDVLCAKWLSERTCFYVVAQKVPARANAWVSDEGVMTLAPTAWRPLPAPPAIRQPDPAGQQEEEW